MCRKEGSTSFQMNIGAPVDCIFGPKLIQIFINGLPIDQFPFSLLLKTIQIYVSCKYDCSDEV